MCWCTHQAAVTEGSARRHLPPTLPRRARAWWWITPDNGTVTALVQLQTLNDAYLEVVRVVDPKVFGYYLRTSAAVSEYNRLDENRPEVQLVFAALYAVVSLVVLLAAIWSGLWAANRLVRPISSLIGAAERVSEGDLLPRSRSTATMTSSAPWAWPSTA